MNNKESIFTEAENSLIKDYGVSEEEVLELRKHRNNTLSDKMKRDLDRIQSGVKEKTAEEILIGDKKWTTQRIMNVDNYREEERAKRYEEDEKKMISASQPWRNAGKAFAKGFGLVVVTALTNIATNELSKTGSKLVKEGAGQGFKLGINTIKEKKRG